jgi:hypothetical protein
MAAATIDLTFISQYTLGCHNVYYRIQGSGDPYTQETVNCPLHFPPDPAPSCSYSINITVDDETCDPVIYEGYVQACCENSLSLEGRVPFTVTFTPNPVCKSYEVTCLSAGVQSVLVDTIGEGYDPLNLTEIVTITDPAGTLATAECIIQDGGIETFLETVAGVANNLLLNGSFSNDFVVSVVGTPSIIASVDYEITLGLVTSINITSVLSNPGAPGNGYSVLDTFTLPAPVGGWATPPEYQVTALDTGKILVCVVTAAGSGYTGPTLATIPAPTLGPPTVQALLSVVNNPCNPVSGFGNNCITNTPSAVLNDIYIGSTVQICRRGDIGAIPADLDIVEGGCCADQTCNEYTVETDPSFTGEIFLTECDTLVSASIKVVIPPMVPYAIGCALTGSVVIMPPSQAGLVTITAGALC